ncbi:MAG: membrane dipeptidase [Oscillospiraceae bacterium]|nr:membrane dipeptidase [Oscillospiraceae bacterium]
MNYFDTHCDTVSEACRRGDPLDDPPLLARLGNFPGMEKRAQCFALFIEDEDPDPWQTYRRYVGCYKDAAAALPDSMRMCREKDDALAAWQAGQCAALLTVENARALGGDIRRTGALAQDGVKAMSLTWNAENEFACGASADGPLKPLGRELLDAMDRCGIAPDVSHLCGASLADLLRRFDGRVLATHSNLRAVCDHPRNLTEDCFREIAARGGVAGLNFYAPFVRADGAPRLDDLLRHADRMLRFGGERSVCIGADFDGGGSLPFCRDVADIPALYAEFLPRFGTRVTDGIFFDNALHFFFGE